MAFINLNHQNKQVLPNSHSNEQLYQIALTLLPNIGDVLAKNLIAYCGSAEAIFKTSKSKLEKIPLIGRERAEGIINADLLREAENELKFINDYKIKTLFFTEKDYPQRLKDCIDSPVLLYYKGNVDLNAEKIVGIVGTRSATEYGKEATKKLVAQLASHEILIVSGLAYGIDISAHHAALENNLNTIGILGNGLNTVYPPQHKSTAKKMVSQGGLLTEYKSTDKMSPHNFPNRNRIIAGICDAIVVIESGIKGGAVLTAKIADSYNKDVYALPGKATDKMSAGCNFLIKTCKAQLIENGSDLLEAMRWTAEKSESQRSNQPRQLTLTLSEDEQNIYNLMFGKNEISIDLIASSTGMNTSILAATLLEMEMNNIIVSLPGKRYRLI